MSYSNGKITAPVSIADVTNALGAASYDLGTLCNHANVNPRAKYKPVRWKKDATSNRDGVSGLTVYINDDNHDYWKGNDGMCGLVIPYYHSESEAKSAVINGTISLSTVVTFARQQMGSVDGAVYPFRLTDFEGYNHTIEASLSQWNNAFFYVGCGSGTGKRTSDNAEGLDNSGHYYVSFVPLNSSDSSILNFTDLKIENVTLDKFFFRVFIYNANTNDSVKSADSDAINTYANQDQIDIEFSGVAEGTYFIVAMCVYETTDLKLYIPLYKRPSFKLVAYGSDVYFAATKVYRDSQGYLYIELTGYNQSPYDDMSIVVSGVEVSYRGTNETMKCNNATTGKIVMASGKSSTVVFKSSSDIATSYGNSVGVITVGSAVICDVKNCVPWEGDVTFTFENSGQTTATIKTNDLKAPVIIGGVAADRTL